MTATQAFDISAFSTSASNLADADAALEWAVDRIWADVAQNAEGFTWNADPAIPHALALRLLERILTALGAPFPRGPDLVRWYDTLVSGGVATLGGVKGDARGGLWRFTRAPDRRT